MLRYENSKIKFSSHAIQRMFERSIKKDTVVDVVKNGEIIQEYTDDKPYPSSLIMAMVNDKPIHVVSAFNEKDNEVYIVTVYIPNNEIWADDFKTRRK